MRATGMLWLSFVLLATHGIAETRVVVELERERAVIVAEQTTAASDQVKEFQAHFVTVSGTCFMAFDRLRPQEEMRDEIIIYDSVADVRDA